MLNQKDHSDYNWWTLSEGWPETTENAYSKYVFANQSNKLIPYGSYVINGETLRVETQELLNTLNEHYNRVREVILEEINDESDNMQIGDYVQYYDPNGSIGKLAERRRYDDGFYVEWFYGFDINGNSLGGTSSMSRRDLRPISKKEYDDFVDSKRKK